MSPPVGCLRTHTISCSAAALLPVLQPACALHARCNIFARFASPQVGSEALKEEGRGLQAKQQ